MYQFDLAQPFGHRINPLNQPSLVCMGSIAGQEGIISLSKPAVHQDIPALCLQQVAGAGSRGGKN